MKDFNNNPLALGDYVAFLEPNYRHMVQGRIVGFTPKQIRIEFTPYYYNRTNRAVETQTCLRDQSYVAKIQRKEVADSVDT
jgi:hypothetical protein